jgi:hypothetical protein
MYGSEKAAEIVKQYELPFMDRFDAQGNEDVPEPPIERLEEE